jgi:hypothetical protein
MNELESTDAELLRGKLRIAQLEREAIERSGDAAKGLRAHLDRYQSLVLAIAQVIWTSDPKGDMVGEQPSWAAYTGQNFEQYQHHGWLDAVHPNDRAHNLEIWERAVTARGPCEYEHRLRRHDGEFRYFSVRAVPVFTDDGAIREWAGIHTDITQIKLTEQSLRDGERQFRELADAMPQIVWAARPDGHFDYYNRRWYDFTGRPEGTGGDSSWADVVHPDDLKESLARWHSAITSGDAYEIEYRLKRKEGDYRWYLTRALPVRDRAATITRWFGTCTDIDERKRTEEELRSSTSMLLQSNRELRDFATAASHDLQEPLRKIQAFVGCLKEEQLATLNAESRNYLDRIQNAASRMTTLVSDLLEFSLITSKGKHFTPVNLNEVNALRRLGGAWSSWTCQRLPAIPSRCASFYRTSSEMRSSFIAETNLPSFGSAPRSSTVRTPMGELSRAEHAASPSPTTASASMKSTWIACSQSSNVFMDGETTRARASG